MLDKDYISYLAEEGKDNQVLWLYLENIADALGNICKKSSIQLDKDYISYLKEEKKDNEALWLYLDYINETVNFIQKNMPMQDEMKDNKMTGMYKIQPPSNNGLHKGPPQTVIS